MDAPVRRSREVTQRRARSAGEHRGHPPGLRGKRIVAERVHAAMDLMQARLGEAVVDGVPLKPQSDQLTTCHDAVLLPREPRDCQVAATRVTLTTTIAVNVTRVRHGGKDGGPGATCEAPAQRDCDGVPTSPGFVPRSASGRSG